MAIPPIVPVGLPQPAGLPSDPVAAPGFGDAMARGIQQISDLEHQADGLIQDVATGGPTKIHEVMAATTESSIAIDLLVNVRDKALEAYHEIMRLQL